MSKPCSICHFWDAVPHFRDCSHCLEVGHDEAVRRVQSCPKCKCIVVRYHVYGSMYEYSCTSCPHVWRRDWGEPLEVKVSA